MDSETNTLFFAELERVWKLEPKDVLMACKGRIFNIDIFGEFRCSVSVRNQDGKLLYTVDQARERTGKDFVEFVMKAIGRSSYPFDTLKEIRENMKTSGDSCWVESDIAKLFVEKLSEELCIDKEMFEISYADTKRLYLQETHRQYVSIFFRGSQKPLIFWTERFSRSGTQAFLSNTWEVEGSYNIEKMADSLVSKFLGSEKNINLLALVGVLVSKNRELQERVQKLKLKVLNHKYAPDSKGYHKAKKHFEESI